MDALKILMVDDEARMRKLVKDFLSKKGLPAYLCQGALPTVLIFTLL